MVVPKFVIDLVKVNIAVIDIKLMTNFIKELIVNFIKQFTVIVIVPILILLELISFH
jgi:hypothetical protein